MSEDYYWKEITKYEVREPDVRSQIVTCVKMMTKQARPVELITLVTWHTGKTPLILYYHEKLSLKEFL